MNPMASQITGVSIVCSDADQRKSVTDEYPVQRGSKAENVSILWRHHEFVAFDLIQEWVPIANIYSF